MPGSLGSPTMPSRRARGGTIGRVGVIAAVTALAAGCGSTIRLGASARSATAGLGGTQSAAQQAAAGLPVFEGPTKEVTLADGSIVAIPEDAHIDATGNVVDRTGQVIAPASSFTSNSSPGGVTTTAPVGDGLSGTTSTTGRQGTTTTRPGTSVTTGPTSASCPSATELRIGFVVLKNSSDYSSTYLNGAPSVGDVPGQVTAVTDYINKRGGVSCKTVKPIFRNYDSQSASQANENTICTGFAQDDKVFAVSLQAMIYEQTRGCYNDKNVLTFDDSSFGMGSATYQANRLFWNPSYPDYTRAVKATVPSLARRGFYRGGHLGIVAFNTDSYHKVVNNDLKPALAAGGASLLDADIYYVDNTGIQSMESGFSTAITGFTATGVNRVMFVGTTPLAPFFITTAKAQSFSPRYGLTTFDNPRYMENDSNLNPLMKGALGVGFNPGGDVADARYSFPASGLEKDCVDIMTAAGKAPPTVNRANFRYGVAHCETLLLFAEGAKQLNGAPLTPSSWTTAAEGLGSSFQTASSFGTSFGPGRHDGASAAKELTFQDACKCFEYTGDLTLPS